MCTVTCRVGRSCRAMVLVAVLLILPAVVQAADGPAEQAAQIDRIMSAAYPPDQPGAAVLVARNGEVIFRQGYGLANLEHKVPISPDTVFRLASATKQFTATAVLMLMERGRLSLDDEITKFLPDYPTAGAKITVAHLLAHTSGIASYTDMPEWMGRLREDLTVEGLIDIFKDQPLMFQPGDKWAYNNSGYVLLGAIIEKASGQKYEDFIREHIFEPAGMKNSYYGGYAKIIPQRAAGYEREGDGYVHARFLSMSQPYASGALLSTVNDMLRWNQALYSGKLIKKDTLDLAFEPFKLNNGQETNYACGWMIGQIKGHRVVQHGGGIFGFSTFTLSMPEDHVYVVLLSNDSGREPGASFLATKLAAIAIGEPFEERKAVEVSPEILESYVGVYEIAEGDERVVRREGGRLFTQRTDRPKMEALLESATKFFYKNSFTHGEFVKDDTGRVTHMVVHTQFAEPEKALKLDKPLPEQRQAVKLDPAVYDRYVGRYELFPGFMLTITRQGDKLMSQATGQQKCEIFPESETEFFLTVVDAQITFVKNEDGTVDRLILHQAGLDLPGGRIK